jgi:hypothetical protein
MQRRVHRAALELLTGTPDAAACEAALALVSKLCHKALADRTKYGRVKRNSRLLKSRLLDLAGGAALLEALGFTTAAAWSARTAVTPLMKHSDLELEDDAVGKMVVRDAGTPYLITLKEETNFTDEALSAEGLTGARLTEHYKAFDYVAPREGALRVAAPMVRALHEQLLAARSTSAEVVAMPAPGYAGAEFALNDNELAMKSMLATLRTALGHAPQRRRRPPARPSPPPKRELSGEADEAPAAKKPALPQKGRLDADLQVLKLSHPHLLKKLEQQHEHLLQCIPMQVQHPRRGVAFDGWAVGPDGLRDPTSLSWAVPLAVESLPRAVEEIRRFQTSLSIRKRVGAVSSLGVKGLRPPCGLLLSVENGTGAKYAHAVAGRSRSRVLSTDAARLASAPPGEALAELRDMFEQASTMKGAYPIVFIDNIERLSLAADQYPTVFRTDDGVATSDSNASGGGRARLVSQLCILMDGIHLNPRDLLVIGATADLRSIDGALRRSGRFDRVVEHVGPPPDWVLLADAEYRNAELNARNSELAARNAELSTRVDEAENPQKCALCLDAPKTHACLPCGHLFACETCAEDHRANAVGHQEQLRCPMCNADATGLLRVWGC